MEAGGGGTWKIKQSARARVQGRSVLEKSFSVFTRCSRSVLLYVLGVLEGKGHGLLLVRSLRCLPCLLFTYSRPKRFSSRLNAFRSALFCLAVFYANELYFQLFSKLFSWCFSSLFSFILAQKASARDHQQPEVVGKVLELGRPPRPCFFFKNFDRTRRNL